MMYCHRELKTQFIMKRKKIATNPLSDQSMGVLEGFDRS